MLPFIHLFVASDLVQLRWRVKDDPVINPIAYTIPDPAPHLIKTCTLLSLWSSKQYTLPSAERENVATNYN